MQIRARMKVSEISERMLISHITGLLEKPGKEVIAGAGDDDCAVLDTGGEDYLCITSDMLHQKTDFPAMMTGRQIGWMSVAVNLSDLAAKGARPAGLVVAMGIPPDSDLSFIEDIVRGMNECSLTFGTRIIGGDIDSHDELTITGTAIGLIKKGSLIRRKGAKTGDLVCVTGNPGKAGTALFALKRKMPVSRDILNALFEPVPRVKEGISLAETRSVTSMMDMSDGLALSLHDLSSAGRVGFKIFDNKLPVLPDMRNLLKGEELLDVVVHSGGDFELLFTVAPDNLEKVKRACSLSVIGEVIDRGVFIEKAGRLEELEARGYEHFGKKV